MMSDDIKATSLGFSIEYECILSDITQISELEKEYFSAPWSLDSLILTANLEEFVCCVLKSEKKVIAYCTCQVIFDEAHIANVAVRDGYRNKGFGKIIMLATIAEAIKKECVSMTLEVGANNSAAKELYLGLGFKPAGIRPKYYNNSEDAIIMWNDNISATLKVNSNYIQKKDIIAAILKNNDISIG